MGCFLACFGGNKERRRRKHKPIKRIPSREGIKPSERSSLLQSGSPRRQVQQLGCSSPKPPQPLPLPEEAVVSDSRPELSDTSQEWISPSKQVPEANAPSPVLESRVEKSSFSSPKKKVTFDLNVKTYEKASICDDDVYSSQEAAEEEKKSDQEEKPQKEGSSTDSLGAGSSTLNHRYQNCVISDDENAEEDGEDDYDIDDEVDEEEEEEDEEGDKYEDSVLDDNKYTMDDRGNDEEESYDSYFSLPLEKEKQTCTEVSSAVKPVACSSPDRQPALVAGQAARDRSQYVHSVLNPVENLLQWKEVKARAHQSKHPKKENISVEEGPEIPFSLQPSFKLPRSQKTLDSTPSPKTQSKQEVSVDASLSTWLPSSETSTPLEGSKGNNSCRTNSTVSLDDRPILGALTIEDLKKHSVSSSSPRRSPSRSPDEIPILGTVGSYWSCTKGDTDSGSSLRSMSGTKGIPNTTSKYREDKRVNWHSTPFQVRLERALSREDAEAYSSSPPGGC
ncbi:hypothetical protein Taro_048419 [Colocasia esculenta]|uniref:Eisosome protein SEG2 n=1 Tax=Colocasia esculenta TaxID=4460 RepID=A0A843X2P9_COLES|nr:hypothetical protein [Colocasia esculenta]